MIYHRYIDELEQLETNHVFCQEPLNGRYTFLIVGTFNPSEESCISYNGALWFYGRSENYFWYLIAQCLNQPSLHQVDNPNLSPMMLRDRWKNFCVNNRIIIVDLLKQIPDPPIQRLPNFKDSSIEYAIQLANGNYSRFSASSAFANISFNRVLFTRSTWFLGTVLNHMRTQLIEELFEGNCIYNQNQIFNLHTPAPYKTKEETLALWQPAFL